MKIQKFEDLPIWQEGRSLSKIIYEITPKSEFKDFSLRDQMRRCAISFASNIAEGFERGSNKEFIQFLYIAKGSLGELRAQIYLAYDNRFVKEEEFHKLINYCYDLSAKTSNFIRYLRNSKFTQMRHKTK